MGIIGGALILGIKGAIFGAGACSKSGSSAGVIAFGGLILALPDALCGYFLADAVDEYIHKHDKKEQKEKESVVPIPSVVEIVN